MLPTVRPVARIQRSPVARRALRNRVSVYHEFRAVTRVTGVPHSAGALGIVRRMSRFVDTLPYHQQGDAWAAFGFLVKLQ